MVWEVRREVETSRPMLRGESFTAHDTIRREMRFGAGRMKPMVVHERERRGEETHLRASAHLSALALETTDAVNGRESSSVTIHPLTRQPEPRACWDRATRRDGTTTHRFLRHLSRMLQVPTSPPMEGAGQHWCAGGEQKRRRGGGSGRELRVGGQVRGGEGAGRGGSCSQVQSGVCRRVWRPD